jgi:hypothetical protein
MEFPLGDLSFVKVSEHNVWFIRITSAPGNGGNIDLFITIYKFYLQ